VRTRLLLGIAAIALIAGAVVYRASVGRRVANPNILLITIDTLRADHLGSYGYAAAETPSLDAVARRGLRFDQALTVTPLTLPAHASLMTGAFPGSHGVRDNGGFVLNDDQTTLAEILRARGYRTGGFVAAFVLDRRWGISQGFDQYSDRFDLSKYAADVGADAVRRPGGEVVDDALAWLNQDTARPFLAWVHLYEPHAPYDPPEAVRARFPPTVLGAYDAEIAIADAQVGRLLNALAADGRLDRTIVAVLGDHGEGLGEHQEQEHGFFVYDTTLRIPLIIAGAGVPTRDIGEQVRIVDVMPTLLELAGVGVPPEVQGRSLVPLARGRALSLVALSETWYPRNHFGWSELTAIRDGRYKLIAAPRRELYDMQTDPREMHDLAASNPGRADALERALRDLTATTSSRKPAAAARPIDSSAAERLRALGYVGGSVSPQSLEKRPRDDPKDKIAVYNLLKQAADESIQAGRLDGAIATVRKALDEDPAIVEGYMMLGGFQRKAKREDEALAAFQQALTLDPHNTKSAWQLADIWIGRREFVKAEAVLKRAVIDAIDRPFYLKKLAECQIELKRYDEAELNLREALQENADDPAAHFDLGLIDQTRGESVRAAAEFEAAIRANPRFGSAYLYLAKARLDRGDLAGAETAAQQGLSLDPAPALAPLGHYVLADVYNRAGRPQDAAREAAAGRRLEQRR